MTGYIQQRSAGSPEFQGATITAWYYSFSDPVGIHGDYQTLRIDFNVDLVFNQQASPVTATTIRGVYSNNQKLVKQFCTMALEKCCDLDIYNKIQ